MEYANAALETHRKQMRILKSYEEARNFICTWRFKTDDELRELKETEPQRSKAGSYVQL